MFSKKFISNFIRKIIQLLLPFIILLSSHQLYGQKKLYFINSRFSNIQRVNIDGTSLEDLVIKRLDSPRDVLFNPENNTLYWSESGKVLSRNLQSQKMAVIVEYPSEGAFTTAIPAIAHDSVNDKLFWIHGMDNKIVRANLDGSDVEDLITEGVFSTLSMAVDPDNQKVYWSGIEYIRRANYDGTQIEDLVTEDIYQPSGIALDTENGMVYWADLVGNAIARCKLDGTNAEDLVSDLENPVDVAVDHAGGKIYWLDAGAFGDAGMLQYSNMDGSGVDVLVDEIDEPLSLAMDSQNNTIFWLDDAELALVGSVKTDGTGQTILFKELTGFENLRISESEQMIYWMDYSSGNIHRARPDGTQEEMLIQTDRGLSFEIDDMGKMIYWTAWDAIRRAGIDGEGIEDLVTTGLDEPDALLLDPDEQKIYWTEGGYDADVVRWANMDGSGVADLLTNLDAVFDLKLDALNNKIFWREGGSLSTELRRANKDGTSTDNIISGSRINSYVLLEETNQLFWSSNDIFTANLDGSGKVTIFDGSYAQEGLSADVEAGKLYWYVNDYDDNAMDKANIDVS